MLAPLHPAVKRRHFVEAASRNGTVMVRDTKDNGRGEVHSFTADEWRAFLAGIK